MSTISSLGNTAATIGRQTWLFFVQPTTVAFMPANCGSSAPGERLRFRRADGTPHAGSLFGTSHAPSFGNVDARVEANT